MLINQLLKPKWIVRMFQAKSLVSLSGTRHTQPPEMSTEIVCCGNGCQNCVWLTHAEKLLEFYDTKKSFNNDEIQRALEEIEMLSDENLKCFLRMELKMKLK